MAKVTELKLSYNVVRAIIFIAGGALIGLGVYFKSDACLFIGIWLAAASLCTFVTLRLAGFLKSIIFSRPARMWICWISFILFAAQQVALDLMMNQANIWNWAILAFDVLVGVGFLAIMKLVLLKANNPEFHIKDTHRFATMVVFLVYVLLLTGKAATMLFFNQLGMTQFPASNVNMMTLVVALLVLVGIMVRLLLIPVEPRLNEFEVFIVYFEATLFTFDVCDSLSLYGELYTHLSNGQTRAVLGVIAGLCSCMASLLYFLPVALSRKFQESMLRSTPNWLAHLYRHGGPGGVDAPLFVIRIVLWIGFKVPISALFMKNFCGVFLLRPMGDYIQFVLPQNPSGRLLANDELNEAFDGPRCKDPPAFYGMRAKELQQRVTLRERQLREHRKALLRYKQELDRMVLEVEKRDRLLALKKDMCTVGAELDDYRWTLSGGAKQTTDLPKAPSSIAISVNQGHQPSNLFENVAYPLPPTIDTSKSPSQQTFNSLAPQQSPPTQPTPPPVVIPPVAPVPVYPAPVHPMTSHTRQPSLTSLSPVPPLPAEPVASGPPDNSAHCSLCNKDVPRSTFLQHFRECSKVRREAVPSHSASNLIR